MKLAKLYAQQKKALKVLMCGALCVALSIGAYADYDPDVNYMLLALDACCAQDVETGTQLMEARNEKIASEGIEVPVVDFEELLLLSKIMYAEAGSEWLSDEWKMAVGEVVLNRVASPEFADTLRGVLEQPGQYYGKNSSYFNRLAPSYRCVDLASRLLSGERVLNDPAVVFQANFRQGSSVHTSMYDKLLGTTYFCRSSHPSLYE